MTTLLGYIKVQSLEIGNRFDTKSSMYFNICRDNYQRFEEYRSQYTAMGDREVELRDVPLRHWIWYFMLRRKIFEYQVTATVFGALCLEAFIYDYAAIHFSDTYTRRYLEKVGFISKWVIIPKLVTRRDFPTDSQAFELLVKLNRERDRLVHAKSKPMPSKDEIKKMVEEGKRAKLLFEEGSKSHELNPYQIVIEVLNKLRKLENEGAVTKCWELREARLKDEQKQ